MAAVVYNRSKDIREAQGDNAIVLDRNSLQYDGELNLPVQFRPKQWAVQQTIFPRAGVRVWIPVPWVDGAQPGGIIWPVGGKQETRSGGVFNVVTISDRELFQAEWEALINPL